MSSKLQEQATAKAELSYSYWAANAAGEAPPPQPKKLTEEEAAAQQQQLAHTASGASAWNAAGTFEERSVPLTFVQEQLSQLLTDLQHSAEGVQVAATEVTSCTGEAHVWIVRGKKRAGFELQLEFSWRAALEGGAAVTGTVKVPHAAADELDDLQLEVTTDTAASTAAGDAQGAPGSDAGAQPSEEQRRRAAQAARGMAPQLRELLERLLERLRTK